MIQKLFQNDPKMIPKWSNNYSQINPTWSQHDPKMIPTLSKNDPKMILKWSQYYPKMIPKWSQTDFKMIPKFVYYSPGDRAQTSYPWRRENKRELLKVSKWRQKINFTFPIIFVYYSPGEGAQKVIPRGAKTNESFWKSQNNNNKPILRFPTFLFTIALVIERKMLSREARKQTRASESFKTTSKNQFYVSVYVRFSPGINWVASCTVKRGKILEKS